MEEFARRRVGEWGKPFRDVDSESWSKESGGVK
jgi:hypothetical protein